MWDLDIRRKVWWGLGSSERIYAPPPGLKAFGLRSFRHAHSQTEGICGSKSNEPREVPVASSSLLLMFQHSSRPLAFLPPHQWGLRGDHEAFPALCWSSPGGWGEPVYWLHSGSLSGERPEVAQGSRPPRTEVSIPEPMLVVCQPPPPAVSVTKLTSDSHLQDDFGLTTQGLKTQAMNEGTVCRVPSNSNTWWDGRETFFWTLF